MSVGFEFHERVYSKTTSPRVDALLQPCYRHFDADCDDDRHYGLFGMAGCLHSGSWSMREALDGLFGFLTEDLQISRERLWVTVPERGGCAGVGCEREDDVELAWTGRGLSARRIVSLVAEHAFWTEPATLRLGRPRLAGPQREVYYDTSERACIAGGACRPGCPCGRFLELANVICIAFQCADGKLVPAPRAILELALGIERLTMAAASCGGFSEIPSARMTADDLRRSVKLEESGTDRQLLLLHNQLASFYLLAADGARPSGKGRGSVMRQLFRTTFRGAHRISRDPEATILDVLGCLEGTLVLDRRLHLPARQVQELARRECELFHVTSQARIA